MNMYKEIPGPNTIKFSKHTVHQTVLIGLYQLTGSRGRCEPKMSTFETFCMTMSDLMHATYDWSEEQHVCTHASALSCPISGTQPLYFHSYTRSPHWSSDLAQLIPATWRHHGLISYQSSWSKPRQDAGLATTPNCYPPSTPPSQEYTYMSHIAHAHTRVNQGPIVTLWT